MNGHLYGPHRPEDARVEVTVLENEKWPRPRQVPIHPALIAQRKNVNALAHRQAVARHA